MSQNEQILRTLQRGWTLTPMNALNYFGCFRLAARIHDLRSKGHVIQTNLVDGHAEYWMEPEDR